MEPVERAPLAVTSTPGISGEAPLSEGCASRAVRVTLFEDRAEVVRVAKAYVQAGAAWVRIPGVSAFVDERSVQARIRGEGGEGGERGERGERVRVTAARVIWKAHREAALGREAIEALEREAERARARAEAASKAADRAQRREARGTELMAKWAAAVAAVPRRAGTHEVLASWQAALGALDRDVAEALAEADEARREVTRATDDLAQAEQRLAHGSIEAPRYEARVEVQLEAHEAHEAEIEITYRVPCALWRPEHLARLVSMSPDGETAIIELVTWATTWQRTGERWDGVEARFSTARPARSAAPPAIADDVLASRRKTDDERRRVRVEVRDQAIVLAGLDRGARAIDEMPSVDDGGEPLSFEASAPVSIAPSGFPFRVEIGRRTLEAKVERVLLPEVAQAAHLRATATLTQGGPLLAGPVRVARGQSLVGRSKVGFIGTGEPFELGFGADDGVRVRRMLDEERDTVAVLGIQKLRRTVRLYLSNLSGEPRRVQVTERIPVSEIDEVEIALVEAAPFVLDGQDGFARAECDLAPHATLSLKLVYEVRASPKVVMPF